MFKSRWILRCEAATCTFENRLELLFCDFACLDEKLADSIFPQMSTFMMDSMLFPWVLKMVYSR